ncbi:MAG TPA: V4R domain-containing protein [Steroidobacteraceae bacterium]|nr:V4R domain-containing protein [Steroidobacteraceae bacterium]
MQLVSKGAHVPVDSSQSAGEITEDGIRYVLMRPDVLMGVAHELEHVSTQRFLEALERSAFRHVQSSFSRYQAKQPLSGTDFVASTCQAAERLGWGVWSTGRELSKSLIVEVRNSPFAAGFGVSQIPVCAAIAGILRAVALTAYGVDGPVIELACASQGAPTCRFEIPTFHRTSGET